MYVKTNLSTIFVEYAAAGAQMSDPEELEAKTTLGLKGTCSFSGFYLKIFICSKNYISLILSFFQNISAVLVTVTLSPPLLKIHSSQFQLAYGQRVVGPWLYFLMRLHVRGRGVKSDCLVHVHRPQKTAPPPNNSDYT